MLSSLLKLLSMRLAVVVCVIDRAVFVVVAIDLMAMAGFDKTKPYTRHMSLFVGRKK